MNNLGIALGAYTQEMNRQREQQRADAADQRQQQQFDLQMQEAERVKGIRSQRESMVNELKAYRAALDNPYDERNFALLRDGAKKHGYGDLTRMGGTLGVFTGGEQGVPQFKPLNPEDFKAQINSAMMDQLVYADPEQALPYLQNQVNSAKDERRWQAGQLTEKQKLDMEERKLQAQIPLINAQAGYYNRMPSAAGGGGGRSDPYGMSDEEAAALNQAIEYEEVAKQLARTNPAAAQQYRLAAVEAMRRVRPRTQLAMRAKFGTSPQEPGVPPKAMEALYDFVTANPGATPQEVRAVKQNLGIPVEPTKLDQILQMELDGGGAPTAQDAPQGPYRFVKPGFLGMGGIYRVFHPNWGEMSVEDYQRRTGEDPLALPLTQGR